MKPIVLTAALCLICSPLAAQIFPTPGQDTPRIQTVQWRSGEAIVLTALPQTGLTLMLEPGETIRRASLSGSNAWDVMVSIEQDSIQVTPQAGAAPASLAVDTDMRSYEFILETGRGLQAAYLVRLQYGSERLAKGLQQQKAEELTGLAWSYRLRGDKSVRPALVRDNGAKTVIKYAEGQALPAVFAIGPTGEEEVVAGYMRGDRFVIDRVHERLVFRIDKEKATARRSTKPEEDQ
ncbi:TrbG/VirB9 family P-type conjugative transfer protein [Erythrobacter sp. MTPC3]|uniref:TrbG/VirB9 family P-type conjugative transfer protein n=1 Tax=Erythrobacter sp. MTPC3 TaxID=3056564 RepID=UPI0036F314DE